MQQPNRNFTSTTYRYGFNGKEKDDELKGEGNSIDLGERIYDSRLGRMFSIDPKANKYPWQTTYAYHRNNLIAWIDYLGGGDPPLIIDGVYFVKIKNPKANIIYNQGLTKFTRKIWGTYDNGGTDDYTVNLQQYKYDSFLEGAYRALTAMSGTNPYITIGQNVEDGVVTGESTDESRGFLAQDNNGKWHGGLGNPPEDSAVGFGGGIPIIVDGHLYGEEDSGEIRSARGYANQNLASVGKVIIGFNSTNNSLILVVSPDELEEGKGMTLDAIRDRLSKEGYNYVFGFDGGSSSTLVKDQDDVLVKPSWYKDNTIPAGIQIRESKDDKKNDN